MSEETLKQPEVAAEAAPIAASDAAEGAAEGAGAPAKKVRAGKSIPAGIAFIRSTFNNTQVSIADARGGVIAWSSAGKAGFKGSRAGQGRESAVRAIQAAGIRVTMITDTTPLAHNGCRPRKRRRV